MTIKVFVECSWIWHVERMDKCTSTVWPEPRRVLMARVVEIPISGQFVTRLDICVVAQTPHIFKHPLQTPYHQMGPPSPWRLSLTIERLAERSIKHLH